MSFQSYHGSSWFHQQLFVFPKVFLEYSFSNQQCISHMLAENSGNKIQHKAKAFNDFLPRSLRVFSVTFASDNRDKNDHFQMTQGRKNVIFLLIFREHYSQTLHCNCYPKVTQATAVSSCSTTSTKKKVIPAEGVVEVPLFWVTHTMAITAWENFLGQSRFLSRLWTSQWHTGGKVSLIHKAIKDQFIYNTKISSYRIHKIL